MNDMFDSIAWKLLQQYSIYIIKFVLQILLARILMPKEFGLIAEVLVFVNIAESIVTNGLGTALVQKKNIDNNDFDTAYISNLFLSTIVYLVIFVFSPFISDFYSNESLVSILRINALVLFPSSFNSIQMAYILRNYELKKCFYSSFISSIISGFIAIYLAMNNYGVWALVFQSISYAITNVLILQLLIDWRPSLNFEIKILKEIIIFSLEVIGASSLGVVLENLYNLIIGKYYNETTLGYYNRGNAYPAFIIGQFGSAIGMMLLPFFSKKQDDPNSLLTSVRNSTHICVTIIFPMAAGLMAISRLFVVTILTEKWLPILYFFKLECIFYGMLSISNSIGTALTAVKRSDVAIKAESCKLILTLLCILIFKNYGIKILCLARTIISILIILYYVYQSSKIIGYNFGMLIYDIYKPLLLSIIMFIAIIYFQSYFFDSVFSLCAMVFFGILLYIAGMFFLMKKELVLFVDFIRNYKK